MKEILILLSDSYTFKIVMLGCSLLGILSAVVGTFAVLKKESLLGDGISHASLAGICLAFLITKQKETVFLLIGAFLIGICCVYLIHYIGIKSKVKFDSAIALILSTFFGLGLVLLTYLKKIYIWSSIYSCVKRYLFNNSSRSIFAFFSSNILERT